MKLASYIFQGQPEFGAVVGDGIINLTALAPTLRDLLATGRLPDIGGMTPDRNLADITFAPTIPNPDIELTVRVHDECNGSDVFGSDICTCRPYLAHGIEECIKTAQKGGYGRVCVCVLVGVSL